MVEETKKAKLEIVKENSLLCNLEPEWKDEIIALLREHGIKTHEEISKARRFALACPALPTCGLAITESERVLPSVVDELEVELAKLGLNAETFTIRMTGCPNGCARPYTSDIGLVGKAVGKYTIFVGGSLLGNRLNVIYKNMVPLQEVVNELVPLFVYFKVERQSGESFGDFCHGKGVEDLLRFDADYKSVNEPATAHAYDEDQAMARDRQTIGPCTHCSRGFVRCSHNLFVKDTLTIHSWEHLCSDCGHRVTEAFRSDQSAAEPTRDPTVCPFCGRQAAA